MANAHGKLPRIGLIAPGIQPIQNGFSATPFPAERSHGMTLSNGAGEGAGTTIHHPIAWRAMNGIAMRGEGFRQHRRRLRAK